VIGVPTVVANTRYRIDRENVAGTQIITDKEWVASSDGTTWLERVYDFDGGAP